jgi:hypothetical protein
MVRDKAAGGRNVLIGNAFVKCRTNAALSLASLISCRSTMPKAMEAALLTSDLGASE